MGAGKQQLAHVSQGCGEFANRGVRVRLHKEGKGLHSCQFRREHPPCTLAARHIECLHGNYALLICTAFGQQNLAYSDF